MHTRILDIAAGLLALAMVGGVHVALAQEKSGAARIAVVDLQFLMKNAAAAKNARGQITNLRADYQILFKNRQVVMDKLRQSIEQERPKLSKQAYQLRMGDLWQKGVDHQRDVRERELKLDGASRRASRKIAAAIAEVADKIKKERNFGLVLPRSVSVGTPGVPDITREVLKRLDRRMPSVAVDLPK